jgi:hypothetical protein
MPDMFRRLCVQRRHWDWSQYAAMALSWMKLPLIGIHPLGMIPAAAGNLVVNRVARPGGTPRFLKQRRRLIQMIA